MIISPIRSMRILMAVTLLGVLLGCQSAGSTTQTPPANKNPDSSGEPRPDRKETVSSREVPPESAAQKGCVQGECENGTGAFVYETGDRYTGSFKNGLREGQGIMEYANGDRYEGMYVADQREGQGTYTFKNKDVFVGQFKKGERDGTGSYRFAASGETFLGEIKGDGAAGEGTVKGGDGELRCSLKGRSVLCEPVKPQTGDSAQPGSNQPGDPSSTQPVKTESETQKPGN